MQVITPFSLYRGEVIGKFVEDKETGYHAYFITDEKNGLVNKRVSSCTGIIGIKDKSAPLVSWATRIARQHLEAKILAGQAVTIADIHEASELHKVRKKEAATIGDEIHEWIEFFIKDAIGVKGYKIKATPKKKEVKLGVVSFLDWVESRDVRFVSSERVVYSRDGQWIGTMDFEAIADGLLAMGDFKSSSGLYNTVRLQTAGYAHADKEEYDYSHPDLTPKQYQTRWAIRLTKETEKEYHERMKEKGLADYPDYVAFEAMEFPENPGDTIDDDYAVFDHARGLFLWDKRTDFYYNRKKNGLK